MFKLMHPTVSIQGVRQSTSAAEALGPFAKEVFDTEAEAWSALMDCREAEGYETLDAQIVAVPHTFHVFDGWTNPACADIVDLVQPWPDCIEASSLQEALEVAVSRAVDTTHVVVIERNAHGEEVNRAERHVFDAHYDEEGELTFTSCVA